MAPGPEPLTLPDVVLVLVEYALAPLCTISLKRCYGVTLEMVDEVKSRLAPSGIEVEWDGIEMPFAHFDTLQLSH